MEKKRDFGMVFMTLAWVLLAVLWSPTVGLASEGSGDLVIFHTNDMHARVTPLDDGGKSIGLAEMVAAVKAVRAKDPDTLWFDAGDTFHGMPRINISRGENMVALLNKSGLDAMVPGNHDFNYGSAQLEKLAKELKATVLSANIVRRDKEQELVFLPYKIFTLPNGIKVAVFGLTTPETAYKTQPKNVETVQFLDPVKVAQGMVRELKPKCDVLVAVMHMGVDKSSEYTSDRIAREAPGIDLIVDGHSHTELPEGLTVGDTLIVQTGWHEYRLGRVDIRLSDHKIQEKRACLLTAEDVKRMSPKPDAGVEKTLARIEKQNQKAFAKVVGQSDRALTSERSILRCRESELGNLCADAIRWRTGAEAAVVNAGGIRSGLPKGKVTWRDCLEMFPFGNTLQTADVKGSTIRSMLEHSVSAYPAAFGGFLDVSGMTFEFHPKNPVGMRVGTISVNGEPLDEGRVYRLAANDFLFAGGDGYTMLVGHPIVGEFDTMEQMMADYLNQVGVKGYETGRIRMMEEGAAPGLSSEEAVEEYPEAA